MTDEWSGYKGIADKDTLHATVSHFQREYVRGIVHTKTLENVWSLFSGLLLVLTTKYP
ncbi:MAG: transposase [Pyrinomonadaceae bacterium]